MVAPSRLNEYPVGTTSPVAAGELPAFCSLVMIRGITDSVEAVPSASMNSSRVYRRNFHRLIPTKPWR